jgi:phage terminase large subunit-like protein
VTRRELLKATGVMVIGSKIGTPTSLGPRDHVAMAKQYARDVVSGKRIACEWVKAAGQRFLDDLKRQGEKEWPYEFDAARAERFCRFAELMPHVKGKWDTKCIVLEPWQCFISCNIFGWIHRGTKLRRFRRALVVVPAKNGKSCYAAIIGLYLLSADGENGPEVYSAATTRDQAKIVWDTAKRMVDGTPGLRQRFGVQSLAHSLTVESCGGFFKPLSRDSDTMEGINAHGVIVDELHAHKSRECFDVLDERTGARRQPLTFIISTEGDNPVGVFAEQVAYGQEILSGRHKDETYFAVVYTIDKHLDWTDKRAWYCANPNLGISVFEDEMGDRCRRAMKNPASQSSFLTKRLNVRVGAGEAYFNMLAWNTICAKPELKVEDFYGQQCTMALDLASKNDVATKVSLFKREQKYVIFLKCYLPEEKLEKGNPNYDFYRGWADRGYLTLTPGNVIDFEFIERDLLEDRKNFKLLEVGFDPWQATQLSTRMLAENLPMVEIPQTVKQMSEPMKEFAGLIEQGRMLHNGDPVLSWMVGNTMARVDAKENVYPRKARPESKIDGAVAGIMALGRAMVNAPRQESVYETRGMRFL